MDPHQSDKLDPDPHQFATTSHNVWNMSLLRTFSRVLSLYSWIRILIRVKSQIRISIRIK
jgi:hypothetical protein